MKTEEFIARLVEKTVIVRVSDDNKPWVLKFGRFILCQHAQAEQAISCQGQFIDEIIKEDVENATPQG